MDKAEIQHSINPDGVKTIQAVQTVEGSVEDISAICDRAKAKVYAEVMSHYQKNPNSPWNGAALVELEKAIKAIYKEWGIDIKDKFKKSLPTVMRQFYDKAVEEISQDGTYKAIKGEPDPKRVQYFLNSAYEQVGMKTEKMSFIHISHLRTVASEVFRETSLTGDTRKNVSKRLLDKALEVPGFQFIDKAGKKWSNKSYFEMLARTELMNAGRASYEDKAVEEGYDVMLLTVSGKPCEKCSAYEGKLFSLTGKTKGLPTKDDLINTGVFHPNCTHSYSAVPEYIYETEYNPDGTSKTADEIKDAQDNAYAENEEWLKNYKKKKKAEKSKPISNEEKPIEAQTQDDVFSTFPENLDGLKVINASIGGSTGAKLVEDANGNRFIMKSGGSAGGDAAGHLINEYNADEAYRAAGVNVPPCKLYKDASGNPVKLSAYIPHGKSLGEWMRTAKPDEKDRMLQKLRSDFDVDVLLGNWDVLGQSMDNILVSADGAPWHIDNGGALGYRAQGMKKSQSDWGDGWPNEIWSMPVSGINRGVFDGIGANEIVHRMAGRDYSLMLSKLPEEDRKIIEKRLNEAKQLAFRGKNYIDGGYTPEYTEKILRYSYELSKDGFREEIPASFTESDQQNGNFGFFRTQKGAYGSSLQTQSNPLSNAAQTMIDAAKTIAFHNKPGGDGNVNMTTVQKALDLKPYLEKAYNENKDKNAGIYLDRLKKMEEAVKNKTMPPQIDNLSVTWSSSTNQPNNHGSMYTSLTDHISQFMEREIVDVQGNIVKPKSDFVVIREWQSAQGGNSYSGKAMAIKTVHMHAMGIDFAKKNWPAEARKRGYFLGINDCVKNGVSELCSNMAKFGRYEESMAQYQAAITLVLENCKMDNVDISRGMIILNRTENRTYVKELGKAGEWSTHNRGPNESHGLYNTVTVEGGELTIVEVPISRVLGFYMMEGYPESGCTGYYGDHENEVNADSSGYDAYVIGSVNSRESMKDKGYLDEFYKAKVKK